MISYELAKQLKDAGFSQENFKGLTPELMQIEVDGGDGHVYFPTLSELIEACGANFVAVGREIDRNVHTLFQWGACGELDFEDFTHKRHIAWADTPEEAVAKLWLELNKLNG